MNIHIVHLPHTFSYLIDLSLMFNKYGFDTVTLVANGFNQDQIQHLYNFADKHSFLRILDIPTKRILSHGQSLNYAFERSQDEFFCFADHDIFPTEPIIDTIQSTLKEFDVACFGNRPENISAQYKGFAASALATQSGIPLATSFFSIYKRSVVEIANAAYKVGFEQYFRKSQIPETLAHQIDIQALKEPFLIDTCKALSLALFQSGKTVSHLDSNMVCHLGGLCGAINRFTNNNLQIKDKFVVQNMPNTSQLENYYLENQKRHPKVLELKRIISDFSLQLLIALKQGDKPPSFICEDENLKNTINYIYQDVSNVFLTLSQN